MHVKYKFNCWTVSMTLWYIFFRCCPSCFMLLLLWFLIGWIIKFLCKVTLYLCFPFLAISLHGGIGCTFGSWASTVIYGGNCIRTQFSLKSLFKICPRIWQQSHNTLKNNNNVIYGSAIGLTKEPCILPLHWIAHASIPQWFRKPFGSIVVKK